MDLLEDAEEHVGVQGALVRLVHDDDAVAVQVRLPERLAQQHPVRHVLYHRLRARAVLKPDRVPHLINTTSIHPHVSHKSAASQPQEASVYNRIEEEDDPMVGDQWQRSHAGQQGDWSPEAIPVVIMYM